MKERLTEKILLYRVQVKQDKEAFAELYDRYIEKIFRFVYFKVSNRQEAEDVASEVFLKTWDYLTNSDTKKIDRFSSFIYQVARNKVIDIYRDRAKTQTCSLDDIETLPSDTTPFHTVSALQEKKELHAAIRQMKQQYQEAVILRYIDGLSIKEISVVIGKRPTAVRVMLHRAMKKLQELLGESADSQMSIIKKENNTQEEPVNRISLP